MFSEDKSNDKIYVTYSIYVIIIACTCKENYLFTGVTFECRFMRFMNK